MPSRAQASGSLILCTCDSCLAPLHDQSPGSPYPALAPPLAGVLPVPTAQQALLGAPGGSGLWPLLLRVLSSLLLGAGIGTFCP